MNIKSQKEWIEKTKDKNWPFTVPKNPWKVYKEKWDGFSDFVGKDDLKK